MLLSEAQSKLDSIDKNNAPIPSKNKGGRGQWVEKQLGMKHSSKLNDFEDGELKDVIDMPTMASGNKNKKQINGSQIFNEISLRIQNHKSENIM